MTYMFKNGARLYCKAQVISLILPFTSNSTRYSKKTHSQKSHFQSLKIKVKKRLKKGFKKY